MGTRDVLNPHGPLWPATDGSVYLWGDNTFGQVGINSTKTPFTTPQRVPITNATILALGIYNSYTQGFTGRLSMVSNLDRLETALDIASVVFSIYGTFFES